MDTAANSAPPMGSPERTVRTDSRTVSFTMGNRKTKNKIRQIESELSKQHGAGITLEFGEVNENEQVEWKISSESPGAIIEATKWLKKQEEQALAEELSTQSLQPTVKPVPSPYSPQARVLSPTRIAHFPGKKSPSLRRLNEDMLLGILSFFVESKCIPQVQAVSKTWHRLSNHRLLWNRVRLFQPDGGINWHSLQFNGDIHIGTEGHCFRCTRRGSGKEYAMKKARVFPQGEGVSYYTLREVGMLREMVHPNINTVEQLSLKKHSLHILFPYVDTTLQEVQEELNKVPGENAHATLPLYMVRKLMKQLLAAVAHCHRRGILHRNIKPKHLLLKNIRKGAHDAAELPPSAFDTVYGPAGSEGNQPSHLVLRRVRSEPGREVVLQLADFAIGRQKGVHALPRLRRQGTSKVVTLWYRAPEILLGEVSGAGEIDMWSVGCVFAEMASGKPFLQSQSSSDIGQLFQIFATLGKPDEQSWPGLTELPHWSSAVFPEFHRQPWKRLLPGLDDRSYSLLSRLCEYDPKARISAEESLSHPFLLAESDAHYPEAAEEELEQGGDEANPAAGGGGGISGMVLVGSEGTGTGAGSGRADTVMVDAAEPAKGAYMHAAAPPPPPAPSASAAGGSKGAATGSGAVAVAAAGDPHSDVTIAAFSPNPLMPYGSDVYFLCEYLHSAQARYWPMPLYLEPSYRKKRRKVGAPIIWEDDDDGTASPYGCTAATTTAAAGSGTGTGTGAQPEQEEAEPEDGGSMLPMHRSMLVDWLVELVEVFDMSTRSLYLAVSFMDKYLAAHREERDQLQRMAAACLHVASKCEDTAYISVHDLVLCADNLYTAPQLLDMEERVLNGLRFTLALPNTYDFLHVLEALLPPALLPTSARHRAEHLCELALQEYTMLQHEPSIVAACAVSLALYCHSRRANTDEDAGQAAAAAGGAGGDDSNTNNGNDKSNDGDSGATASGAGAAEAAAQQSSTAFVPVSMGDTGDDEEVDAAGAAGAAVGGASAGSGASAGAGGGQTGATTSGSGGEVAVAAVAATAGGGMSSGPAHWPRELEHASRHSWQELKECMQTMQQVFVNAFNSNLTVIRTRYEKAERSRVAEQQPPLNFEMYWDD